MNNEIKNRVLKHVVEHPGADDLEISEALKLSIVDVTEALLLLEDDGLVKRG